MSDYWSSTVYDDVEREHAADRAEARQRGYEDELYDYVSQASPEDLAADYERRPRWWRR